MKFLVQARQQQGVWVDVEKPFWYDMPVWLASGMVNSIGIAHNHMQRDGVYRAKPGGVPATSRGCPTRRGTGFGRRKSTITP